MTHAPHGRESEAGVSLIEVVVALFIMSTAVLALVGGLSTSIVATDMHRKSVTSDAVVRNWAEQVQAAPWIPCAPKDAGYALPSPLPPNFTAQIVAIDYWNGTTSQPAVFGGSCAPGGPSDTVQRITLGVRSTDDRGAQQVQILKRKP